MGTITDAIIQFNADRDRVLTALGQIQYEWQSLGITTPVVDDAGEIDQDALLELADRL